MRRGTTAGEGDTFEKVLTVAGMELDTTSRVVSAGATRVELTSVEFMLLELLMRSSGEVLGREYLTEKVLGRRFYQFDRGLDMHISRLRRKLDRLRVPGEPHTLLGEQVKTIRGLGYQLAAAGRKAQEG
jgi:DNA-binding response OmpR family regulator